MAEPPRRRRGRGMTRAIFAVAGTALAAIYAIPAFRYLRGLRSRDDDSAVDAGPLADLPEDRPQRVALALHGTDAWSEGGARAGVYLVRSGQSVRVIDAACPHSGCAVDWNAEALEFRCPCHKSRFSLEGARLSGPSPRGLDPQSAEVRDGRVLVRYRRYRAGRAERVPI
jgi:menaquinol-cytochrome c reductase iron-sulfur subunit